MSNQQQQQQEKKSIFSQQDAQLAFAVLGSAACTTDASSNILQPLLVRASTTTAACPLLLALRDIISKRERVPPPTPHAGHDTADYTQSLINVQLQEYEGELKDAERQCEPLKIARDKLKAELQRVETLLQNAEAATRRANDGVLVCRSLLQSLNLNLECGLDVTMNNNNNSSNGIVGNQFQPQHQHQLSSSSNNVNLNSTGRGTTAPPPSNNANSNNNNASSASVGPSIPSQYQQQQQKREENNVLDDFAASPQPVPPTPTPSVNSQQNSNDMMKSPVVAAAIANPSNSTPLSIDGLIDLLRKCQQQKRDDEFRAQLIPALARVERRITNAGALIEAQHAELTAAIMGAAPILHESVQVHALRAVLGMLRKIAEEPSCLAASLTNNSSNNLGGPNSPLGGSGGNDLTGKNSLATRLYRAGFTSCTDEQGFRTFISLFSHSHDDDVKAEVLECLGVVAGEPHFVELTTNLGIVDPLVQLVATSTSEPVLERALLLFWSLAQVSDRVKDEAIQCGAVRALVDLLYTDSLPILDNTMIALGYMSREDRGRLALAEGGGLEKMVSSLYHPNASVVIKAAGVVWNAAVIDGNRTHLRSLGAVPALLQLLRNTKSELAQENIAGALWNLTIDAEAKKQIADYDGLPLLVALLNNAQSSENVLENVTGTLWNCSATIDNRAALRRHGALVPLLRLLSHSAVRIQENSASAIRNLVINDHNKVAVRENGGIEMIVSRLENSWNEIKMSSLSPGGGGGNPNHNAILGVIDKLATTLWILTVTPENRQRLQPALGLLLDFVGSDLLNVQTREKIIGTLRNCGGFQDNRKPLVQLGAFTVISNFAASLGLALPTDAIPSVTSPPLNTSITLRENIAFTLWHLAREDRDTGRRSGALGVVAALLGDKNDNVLEPAAGAVAALINSNTNEGRNELGALGGVDRLVDVLENVLSRVYKNANNNNASSTSSGSQNANLIVLLHNILHALRYSTSSGCDANISCILDRVENVVARIASIIENGPVSGGNAAGAINADDVTREAALLLKNIFSCSSDSRVASLKMKYSDEHSAFMRRLGEIISVSGTNTSGNNNQNDPTVLLFKAASALQNVLLS